MSKSLLGGVVLFSVFRPRMYPFRPEWGRESISFDEVNSLGKNPKRRLGGRVGKKVWVIVRQNYHITKGRGGGGGREEMPV